MNMSKYWWAEVFAFLLSEGNEENEEISTCLAKEALVGKT